MGKWDKRFNPPPVHRNPKLERMGSKAEVCERILTTYIETKRSVRSLARMYGCSKSTVGRYIKQYAMDLMPYSMYEEARKVANKHLGRYDEEDEWEMMCRYGDNDDCGSLD